jgi:NitT/TauT family transport system permease protein
VNLLYDNKSILRRILPLCGALLCIGIWEANSQLQLYQILAPSLSPAAFPSFFAVVGRFAVLVSSSGFWSAVGVTVMRTLLAFFIAAALGICLGLLSGRLHVIGTLLNIPVEFFRNLPAVAAMPIFILFLGIGTPMKVALCVFGAIFPILIAARMAIENIREEIHIAARFYQWTGWRLIILVLLPAALPEIAAASQTGLAISLILAVMGEMLIGGDGIGSMIVDAERTFNHIDLYALVFALGVIGSLLAFAFRQAANRLIFWKTAINWQQS